MKTKKYLIKNFIPIAKEEAKGFSDVIECLESIEHYLNIQMDAEVKPACEMERPTLENFLPKGTTIRAITNMFLANPTLYAYINTLDEYIDKLESKSV